MSVIDNTNLGILWNRILGLFSLRKVNGKSLSDDVTIEDADIASSAVTGETTVEGALEALAGKTNVFTGATSGTAGTAGLVKAPAIGDNLKFLRGDGNWIQISAEGSSLGFLPIVQQIATTNWEWSQSEQKYVCTIYNEAITDEMVVSSLAFDDAVNIRATVYEGTADGTTHTITLKTDTVPDATVTAYIGLTADGTTVMEDVSELTTPFIGATSSTDGREGLVPQPLEGEQNLFLCADGDWKTPPGSKTTVKTYTSLTPTSNVLNFTQSDADIIGEMKAIKIEPSDPSVFLAPVVITCNEGSINITCSNMSGTCTSMKVTLVMQAGTSSITSSEFDLLATRIGNLSDLDTDIKTSLVGAVNDVNDSLGTLSDQIVNLGDAIAYRVNGNTSIVTVPSGAYVLLTNSTISGRADGIYTASQSIPANTVIDATYLSESAPIPGGGFNTLSAAIDNLIIIDHITINSPTFKRSSAGAYYCDINVTVPAGYVLASAIISNWSNMTGLVSASFYGTATIELLANSAVTASFITVKIMFVKQ